MTSISGYRNLYHIAYIEDWPANIPSVALPDLAVLCQASLPSYASTAGLIKGERENNRASQKKNCELQEVEIVN